MSERQWKVGGNARSTLNDTWRWYQNISKVLSLRVRLVLGMNCMLLQKRVSRGSIQRGGLPDRRDPLPAGTTKTNSVRTVWSLPKFQDGQWTAGGWSLWRRHASTTKTAKPPIHQSLSSIADHGRRDTTRRREKITANVIPGFVLAVLCLLSDHRTPSLPGLVDNCHFILSLFYKSACIVPSTRARHPLCPFVDFEV